MSESGRINPLALPIPDAARLLSKAGGRTIRPDQIDADVLELFQEDGPGWQDRINAALREAVRPRLATASGGGSIRVDELNTLKG